MIGAVTTYALNEKRKRKEEEAQQAAQVQAEVDAMYGFRITIPP